MTADILLAVVPAAIAIVIGYACGFSVHKHIHTKNLNEATSTAEGIIAQAKTEAATLKKETVIEAKDEANRYRNQVEDEVRQRRNEVAKTESRLDAREETLDRRDDTLDRKEQSLADRDTNLSKRQDDLDALAAKLAHSEDDAEAEMARIAELTPEAARKEVLDKTRDELTHERAVMVRESEDEARSTAGKTAKTLIADAIQRSAADIVTETTVTVVNLPTDDMKGRIIGREGRNIRTLETLTGIDIIIDDTPEAVVLSGFDPIRREIARMALEALIQDGRIHQPALKSCG